MKRTKSESHPKSIQRSEIAAARRLGSKITTAVGIGYVHIHCADGSDFVGATDGIVVVGTVELVDGKQIAMHGVDDHRVPMCMLRYNLGTVFIEERHIVYRRNIKKPEWSVADIAALYTL